MLNSFNNNFNSNPNDLQHFFDLTKDSYALFGLDNVFCIFNSVNDILYLIYTNVDISIISFNILENKKINEIKNAHKQDIINFRYYLDINNNRDLVLSLSALDNNLKIWNINIFECLVNIQNVNDEGLLKSSCFLNDNNIAYIITSNYNNNDNTAEAIKVYDLTGTKIKEINDSNYDIIFITIYYDTNLSTNFIVAGSIGYILSYNYNENCIYMKYVDKKKYFDHSSIIIYNNEGIIKMIESCGDGNIRIWNFHNGDLLKTIEVSKAYLYSICLWNDDNLLVACRDLKIKLVDLKQNLVKKEFGGYNKEVLTIKKLYHPIFGECLISQGKFEQQIKLWIIKK